MSSSFSSLKQRRRLRYVPDIARLGAVCDANYARMMKLSPELVVGLETRINLFFGPDWHGTVSLKVTEVAKYTTTYFLQQLNAPGPWLNNPEMSVRLYHDARMAEVISLHRYRRVEAVHDYPNAAMHLPDEKLQINVFLGEWLAFCESHGAAELELPVKL